MFYADADRARERTHDAQLYRAYLKEAERPPGSGRLRPLGLMGHTNGDVTLKVYTQMLDDSMRAAVDRVGNELFTLVHRPEGAPELSR